MLEPLERELPRRVDSALEKTSLNRVGNMRAPARPLSFEFLMRRECMELAELKLLMLESLERELPHRMDSALEKASS